MAGVTLFREGAHITDVGVRYNGEIAIGSGGAGGEFYTRIPAHERAKLFSALAEACGRSLAEESSDEGMLTLFKELFGNMDADPYTKIREFLTAKKITFQGEYWPDR